MLFGPVIDGSLALLRHPILIARSDAPPAVIDPVVNARLVVFKTYGFESQRLALVALSVWIKAQPESSCIGVVHRNAKAERMIRNTPDPRGGMPRMRRKDPMGKFRLGHTRNVHGNFRAVRFALPTDHRPLQGHMRILGRMERNQMTLI